MNKIDYEHRLPVYKEALSCWGLDAQMTMAIEEMSELTKEICKARRGSENKEAIADEIADVTIMLEQLRAFLDINDAVCARMDYKIERLQGRLEKQSAMKKYEVINMSDKYFISASDVRVAQITGLYLGDGAYGLVDCHKEIAECLASFEYADKRTSLNNIGEKAKKLYNIFAKWDERNGQKEAEI